MKYYKYLNFLTFNLLICNNLYSQQEIRKNVTLVECSTDGNAMSLLTKWKLEDQNKFINLQYSNPQFMNGKKCPKVGTKATWQEGQNIYLSILRYNSFHVSVFTIANYSSN